MEKQYEVEIKKIGINAEGIAYLKSKPIFIPGAIPGEIVLINNLEEFNNYYTATVEQIIKKSEYRILSLQDYQKDSSGAFAIHIDYNQMLVFKEEILRETLMKYVKNTGINFNSMTLDVLPSPMKTNYRNKASLVARYINGKTRFGLYKVNTNIFVELKHQMFHSEIINDIYDKLAELFIKYKITSYEVQKKLGSICFVVIREAHFTKEVQITFVSLDDISEKLKNLLEELVHDFPVVKNANQTIIKNPKIQEYFNHTTKVIFGRQAMKDQLNEKTIILKPGAFYQLNTPQANNFYQEMVALSDVSSTSICLDAFCGNAPISLFLADKVKQVYGIDNNQDAIKGANISLKENNIKNIKLYCSDFFKEFKKIIATTKIDTVFFDPPRTGLGDEVIKTIINSPIETIVYGSCNPATLAKDLNFLLKKYRLKTIKAFDMFPYTQHIETIAVLVKK